MADAFLIETMSVNPYDWIIANTDSQIADINNQIQLVSNEINKLEASNPTSPTLSQLRERLSSLQSKKEWLTSTNESAKSLSQSFNQWQQNVNTLKWIYDIKQQELEKARAEDERAYMQMIEDTKRDNQNYINALWNATASENAIINANAWRQWASEQSTSEARARNYLNNAQTQAEAANNARTTINNLEQARMNSNQWYTQLSQSNADNYLRQQVLADMEAAENEKTRQAQYWNSYWRWGSRWTSSRWTNNIFDPYSLTNNNNNNNNNNNKTKTLTMDELKKITHEKLDPLRHSADYYDNNYEYQKSLLEEEKNALKEQALNWTISLDKYKTDMDALNNQEKLLNNRWKYESRAQESKDKFDKNKNEYINNIANQKWTLINEEQMRYRWWENDYNKQKINEAKSTYLNSRKK